MAKDQLNAEQLQAISEYAALYGRTWKSHLRTAWCNGNYHHFSGSHLLQQIRNSFGPTWLVNFRLPKAVNG